MEGGTKNATTTHSTKFQIAIFCNTNTSTMTRTIPTKPYFSPSATTFPHRLSLSRFLVGREKVVPNEASESHQEVEEKHDDEHFARHGRGFRVRPFLLTLFLCYKEKGGRGGESKEANGENGKI